jgi:hypothetical protein
MRESTFAHVVIFRATGTTARMARGAFTGICNRGIEWPLTEEGSSPRRSAR